MPTLDENRELDLELRPPAATADGGGAYPRAYVGDVSTDVSTGAVDRVVVADVVIRCLLRSWAVNDECDDVEPCLYGAEVRAADAVDAVDAIDTCDEREPPTCSLRRLRSG